MTRTYKTVIGVVAAVVLASLVADVAMAQRGRRGRGFGVWSPADLAAVEKVQTELNLNGEQVTKTAAITDQYFSDRRDLFQGGFGGDEEARQERREKMQELRSNATAQLMEVLEPAQGQRLKEITLQFNGTGALTDPDVAGDLNVTEGQESQIGDIRGEMFDAFRDAFEQGGDASREERRARFDEIRKEYDEKILAVLTTEQRDQFETMKGEPFELDRSEVFRSFRGR